MISLKGINKGYSLGKEKVEVLKDISMDIGDGEFVCIYGKSGCGKSTLLNIIGLMDTVDSGEYYMDDINTGIIGRTQKDRLRSKRIGFVFQAFHLIPDLNVFENIVVPLGYQGISKKQREKRGEELLERVGLLHRRKHYPSQLSGGEKQRTAIARALAASPDIIVADEPTGNLDTQNGESIMHMLSELNRQGITVIAATHDHSLKDYASRVIHLEDGRLCKEMGVLPTES